MREEERRRMRDLERQRERQRDVERRQREEAMRLEREKERLRYVILYRQVKPTLSSQAVMLINTSMG